MRGSLTVAVVIGATLASAVNAGCRARRLTPEQQIRQSLSQLEEAVEEKDLDEVGRYLAEGFRDSQANDRQAVMNLIRLQFVRYPSIHLLTRVPAVDVSAEGTARATLFAAMAGLAMPDTTVFAQVGAELYRFDLDLVSAGGDRWQVKGATWAPARPDDFVGK
jgi:hypothetical protein